MFQVELLGLTWNKLAKVATSLAIGEQWGFLIILITTLKVERMKRVETHENN